MPKFAIKVKSLKTGEEWEEKYDKPVTDIHQWSKDLIDWFNRTCRTSESHRELLGVRIITKVSEEHVWEKSNLVTQIYRDRLYDTSRCSRCGITGKRYGLSGTVARDRQYKAKKYAKCSGNMEGIRHDD